MHTRTFLKRGRGTTHSRGQRYRAARAVSSATLRAFRMVGANIADSRSRQTATFSAIICTCEAMAHRSANHGEHLMRHDPDGLRDLLPYASPGQARCIQAAIDAGSFRAGAKKIGVNQRTVAAAIAAARKKAALQGLSPEHDMVHTVPDGFTVKGVSTLYGADGGLKVQWVKSRADDDRREAIMREAAEAFSDELPRANPAVGPLASNDELMVLYPVTDLHIGMLSWPEETGADWNVKIAEDTILAWFKAAIAAAPPATTCVFAQMGDFLHHDSLDSVTPTSRHVLDADSRLQKIIRVSIRVMRKAIEMLLEKHKVVSVLALSGNHDQSGGIWLRELLSAHYENEPRVLVDTQADAYNCVMHGDTALFFHHGDKRTVKNVDSVFAGKFREQYGASKHAYAHVGHRHHTHVIESNLMVVEQHRTLAAPDAFAARGGWLSGRSAAAIVYHKKYGEVGRTTISPELCLDGSGANYS